MKLSRNVGTPDQVVRVVVGILIAAALVAGAVTGPLAYLAVLIAAIMLVTGVVGFCPLYAILGLRTRPATRA
jgi:hypothetical protein